MISRFAYIRSLESRNKFIWWGWRVGWGKEKGNDCCHGNVWIRGTLNYSIKYHKFIVGYYGQSEKQLDFYS